MTLGLAFLLAAPSFVAAQADNDWVGKRVVQKYARFQLQIENQVIDTKKRLETYRVEQVNGPWLWLHAAELSGWALADQVVPVEEAIAFFTDFIRANPGDPHGYTMRAKIWDEEKKELDIALADFTEAIRLDPRMKKAYYQRGLTSYYRYDPDRAIRDFTEVIRLDPSDLWAHVNRGNAWEMKGEHDKAIADFSEAIRLEPKSDAAYINRGNAFYARRQLDRALSDFTEAIRLNPRDPDVFRYRGDARFKVRAYREAAADYTEALRLNPSDRVALINRGLSRDRASDHDGAIADFSETIRLNPKYARAYYLRALSRIDCRQYAECLADLRECLRINPKNVAALNRCARLLATCPDAAVRDGKKAVEMATRACELSGWKDPDVIDTLAASCAEAGDFDAAVQRESQAIELARTDAMKAAYRSRSELYKTKKPSRS